MSENNKLKKIQQLLTPYFCYFKDKNILAISEDKATLPFAFVMNDEAYPDTLLLSLAVDYPNAVAATEIALTSSSVFKTSMSESFYISSANGRTFFGNDAYECWEFETSNLNELESISKELH